MGNYRGFLRLVGDGFPDEKTRIYDTLIRHCIAPDAEISTDAASGISRSPLGGFVKHISSIVLGLAVAFSSVPAAHAGDNDPPTAADLDKAKKAFVEGKKLHEAGKLELAIEKFKESHKLSKNPLLLYNIALVMEQAQMEDLALMYYRRFLKEAPADAAQRPTVEASVKTLEAKLMGGTQPTPPGPGPGEVKPNPVKDPTKNISIKPPGTYKEDSFQHQVVDTAPPGKPLDVTAFVPEDSGFVVTLYYRTAGEGKWTQKVMKWRYKELVSRIPAPKMIGSAVQYYIDVKDSTGASVARSGKSTSPHQVLLEAGAQPRFYPDMTEDGDPKATTQKMSSSRTTMTTRSRRARRSRTTSWSRVRRGRRVRRATASSMPARRSSRGEVRHHDRLWLAESRSACCRTCRRSSTPARSRTTRSSAAHRRAASSRRPTIATPPMSSRRASAGSRSSGSASARASPSAPSPDTSGTRTRRRRSAAK